jgi:hypothetical protein
MPFTDRSDIFGAVHDEGINRVVQHIMRQRPSLFNYATAFFLRRPDLLCARIDAAPKVIEARNPLFTVQDPLPIIGTPIKLGLNYCIQFTDFQIDFHPGSTFQLPPQLGTLPPQRMAFRFRACAGIDCPSDRVIGEAVRQMELAAVQQGDTIVKPPTSKRQRRLASLSAANFTKDVLIAAPERREIVGPASRIRDFDDIVAPFPDRLAPPDRGSSPVLPTEAILCVCLELFAVAHFEWGTIGNDDRQWLKPRLDGLEIVDLQPTPMEDAIECYLKTVLRLGVLPRLVVPMEAMILNITEALADQGFAIEEKVTLGPAPISAQLPHNPAIEQNLLKAFINLTVEEV